MTSSSAPVRLQAIPGEESAVPCPMRERSADTNAGIQRQKQALVCRRMTDADIEPAIVLLGTGFPERPVEYWRQALARLQARPAPDGFSPYGWVMTEGTRLIGIIIVIFATPDGHEVRGHEVRGNVSSWYVDPAYRAYSHMLLAAPLRLKHVTLFNISPAPTTIGTIEAQGFVRYVDGTFICCPTIVPAVDGAGIRRVAATDETSSKILRDHAAWGCLSFEVSHDDEKHPFILVERRFICGLVPCAQLIYCRRLEDFVRFAGVLGRQLLRYGIVAVLIDAKASIPGLPGLFRAGHSPKFYKGPAIPRHGDLSYTELAMFGS